MSKFRSLPAIITLLAGFIASVVMIIHRYSLVSFMWILVCTMLAFYVISVIVCVILNKAFVEKDIDFMDEDSMADELEDTESSEMDEV